MKAINTQLVLSLPISQDLIELAMPGEWERMQEEYDLLSLYPDGHVMAKLRPRFRRRLHCSKDIEYLRDGARVETAGLVIRRQRPHRKVVFITLEDEFGHIPLMVFPKVYEANEHSFKSAFLIIKGRMSRREGTHNVIVESVRSFSALEKVPESRDWR